MRFGKSNGPCAPKPVVVDKSPLRVRREKALDDCGCKSCPGTGFAPLGSNRSGGRGNEAVGASGVEGHIGDLASMQAVT